MGTQNFALARRAKRFEKGKASRSKRCPLLPIPAVAGLSQHPNFLTAPWNFRQEDLVGTIIQPGNGFQHRRIVLQERSNNE